MKRIHTVRVSNESTFKCFNSSFFLLNINKIHFVYGRNNFQNLITNLANNNAIIYWNKNKSQDLSVNLGIQFPNIITRLNFNSIIHKANSFVNTQNKK